MKTKITINPSSVKSFIRARDTKIGDFMTVQDEDSSSNGHILLRTYDGFVDINDPEQTYGNFSIILVELLPKETVIEIIIEKD